jgi:general secretion pathway protein E/type IV pilus assembly protein PilB
VHYVPEGCEDCNYSGYKGRKAIYEVINIDAELSDKIKEGELKVDKALAERGIKKINEKAFGLLKHGFTSLEEVYALLTTL